MKSIPQEIREFKTIDEIPYEYLTRIVETLINYNSPTIDSSILKAVKRFKPLQCKLEKRLKRLSG